MDTDVLIVGAGPTGLMLACWLARLGIRPLVIDQEAARAGLQAGACYLLRPDGYVAYAASSFSSEEFLTFLRDTWGWLKARAKQPGK